MINEKAQLFRHKMAEQDLLVCVEAGTALEAKLIERAGSDFVWSSSLAVSAHYDVPDASLISMNQYLRASCYAEAGADLLLIHSKSGESEEVRRFCQSWQGSVPLVLVPTTYPQLKAVGIRALGSVKLVIYANHPLRAAVRGIEEALQEMKCAGGIHTLDERLAPVSHIFEIESVPQLKENENNYVIESGEKI